MKISKIAYIVVAAAAWFVTACNSDDSTPTDNVYVGASSVMVNSMSLGANDSVLANLDSVYFSIDLDKGRIFNADSLPKGTKVSALVLNLGLPTVRVASLREYGATPNDTIDYLTNSTDTVDFSKGPVTLHLVSYNGEVSRDYIIEVNVHKVASDSLAWAGTAQATLPTDLSAPQAQGTVEIDGTLICFASDGTAATRATATDAYAGTWAVESVTLPAGADVSSVTAVGDKIFMLDSDSHLHMSADRGDSWNDTGATMSHIYGSDGKLVLGVRHDADGYKQVTYPATTEKALDPDCPVSGTSQTVTYVSEWSAEPLTLICGGVKADGTYTGATWAYDGSAWTELSASEVPAATGLTLVPYFYARISSTWKATQYSVLLAFGGKMESGEMNRDTYISYDRGVNWSKASNYLRIPDKITPTAGAQAFVLPHTLTAATSRAWSPVEPQKLPVWATEIPAATLASRAVTPVTEWECPFIYLFGGLDANGALSRNIWRGAVNRLTFKPLQ